jgi:hypothetical protein
MAITPQGSWAGSGPFGLRDLLEQSRLRPEKVQTALAELNRALRALGLDAYRAAAIERESPIGDDTGRWTIRIESVADPTRTYALRWNGRPE